MSKSAELNRDDIVKQATELGIKEDHIVRLTTYALLKLITEKRERNLKAVKPSRADKDAREVVRELQELKNIQAPHENDDAQTVVDMQFITESANPAEQRYKRFRDLVEAKKVLESSRVINKQLLDRSRTNLDEDDVRAIEREIADANEQLPLIEVEMAQINRWYADTFEQRKAFYQQFMTEASDLSGRLKDHFNLKLQNIRHHMEEFSKSKI